MGFFNWAAPLFGHYADRWAPSDVRAIASWATPDGMDPGAMRILDVGGGTGALARRLHAETGAALTVLDPTPQMLKYVPDSGPVQKVQAAAESMPFPDASFDAVIVTDAFHHFRDQPGAVDEFARVVKPGGRVIIIDLDPTAWYMRLVVIGERLLGEPGAFFSPEGLCEFMAAHGIAGECTQMNGPGYRYVGTVIGPTAGERHPFQR